MKPTLASLISVVGEIALLHKEWSYRCFGDSSDPSRACLGIVEELGEFVHARLKSLQGIRGTQEEHAAAMADAIGDALLYTMDALARFFAGDVVSGHRMLSTYVEEIGSNSSYLAGFSRGQASEQRANAWILSMVEQATWNAWRLSWDKNAAKNAARIVVHIDALAEIVDADPAACLRAAWGEINGRDWVANPVDGRTEGGAQ